MSSTALTLAPIAGDPGAIAIAKDGWSTCAWRLQGAADRIMALRAAIDGQMSGPAVASMCARLDDLAGRAVRLAGVLSDSAGVMSEYSDRLSDVMRDASVASRTDQDAHDDYQRLTGGPLRGHGVYPALDQISTNVIPAMDAVDREMQAYRRWCSARAEAKSAAASARMLMGVFRGGPTSTPTPPVLSGNVRGLAAGVVALGYMSAIASGNLSEPEIRAPALALAGLLVEYGSDASFYRSVLGNADSARIFYAFIDECSRSAQEISGVGRDFLLTAHRRIPAVLDGMTADQQKDLGRSLVQAASGDTTGTAGVYAAYLITGNVRPATTPDNAAAREPVGYDVSASFALGAAEGLDEVVRVSDCPLYSSDLAVAQAKSWIGLPLEPDPTGELPLAVFGQLAANPDAAFDFLAPSNAQAMTDRVAFWYSADRAMTQLTSNVLSDGGTQLFAALAAAVRAGAGPVRTERSDRAAELMATATHAMGGYDGFAGGKWLSPAATQSLIDAYYPYLDGIGIALQGTAGFTSAGELITDFVPGGLDVGSAAHDPIRSMPVFDAQEITSVLRESSRSNATKKMWANTLVWHMAVAGLESRDIASGSAARAWLEFTGKNAGTIWGEIDAGDQLRARSQDEVIAATAKAVGGAVAMFPAENVVAKAAAKSARFVIPGAAGLIRMEDRQLDRIRADANARASALVEAFVVGRRGPDELGDEAGPENEQKLDQYLTDEMGYAGARAPLDVVVREIIDRRTSQRANATQ